MRKRPSKDIAPDYYELRCTLAMAFILQNGIGVIFFVGGGGVFWKTTAHSDCVVNPTTRSLSFFIGLYCWCKLDFDLKVLVQCACTILTLFNVSQSF